MVLFSTTGLLLYVALFRLGTTHDCAIGQAGPSIWSRLPPAIPSEVHMRRIGLAVMLVVSLLAPLVLQAEQARKVWRIGLIAVAPRKDQNAVFQGLRELGYVEGENLAVERRYSEGRAERFPEFAAELVRLNVDVILVETTPAALAVKRATRTIPVVFPTAIDPVGAGVVASLARPGANFTGLTTEAPDLVAKRLQLLREVVPRLFQVAVLWNAANPAHGRSWSEA